MRKIVVTEFLTLDGIMSDLEWTIPYWSDEIGQFKSEEEVLSDALLLGRVTYQGFAAAWPQSEDEGADYFNSVRKYVVSKTLKTADWNNSVLIQDDVVDALIKLKQQDGKNIVVHGSGNLIQTLIAHDLVDEYRLLVYPVVLGKGQRLFANENSVNLTLIEARPLPLGVIGLVYEPVRA